MARPWRSAAPRDRSWTRPGALTDRMSRPRAGRAPGQPSPLRRSAALVTGAILWLILWPGTCGNHPGRGHGSTAGGPDVPGPSEQAGEPDHDR